MFIRGQLQSWPGWQRHQKGRQNSWKKTKAETLLTKHWINTNPVTDQSVLESIPWRKKPKMAPWTSCALPGVLGRWWQDEVEPGAFLGLGGQEQANQGVLKPKGFFRSPAEKRSFSEQSHVQAARFIPEVWSQQLGNASPEKGNSVAENTEIATCLNSWQTVGKVTLFCSLPRDKGLAI